MQGARSRLRIHKIGVHGDDWQYFQERRAAQPTTEHIRLRLQGKNPFGNSGFEYERHVAKMKARRQSLNAPSGKAKQAEDHHFRSIWHLPEELYRLERHTTEMNTRHPRRKNQKPRDVRQEANGVGEHYSRQPQPHNHESAIGRSKGIYLRRLWGHDDAPSEVARKHQHVLPRQVLQLQDKPKSTGERMGVAFQRPQSTVTPETARQASDGQRLVAHQPQGATDLRAESESWAEMSPRVQKAITRQLDLVTFEKTPLFSSRTSGALEDALSEAPRAKPIDTFHHSGELAVAAADIGPAESLQRSFTEDPVLVKANSLARMLPFFMPSPSMHAEPRFRLVPSWRSTPRKILKSPQPPQVEPKSLESHISELQPEQPQERPVEVLGSISIKPEATDIEESKATDAMELKASHDRSEADTKDALASEEEGSGAVDEGSGLEATQPPAQDNRTIFEKLFEERDRTKGPAYGQQYSKLKIAEKAAARGGPSAVNPENEPELPASLNRRHGLSIFRQLFPDQAESETARSERESSRATHGLLHPPEDSVMVSLRNEVRNWMSEEGQDQTSWPKPGDYGSHSTVVVISGTSPSLIDTDFYRIAPDGQHVEGWAGGLVKVIQAHDSISYEPLGQYYLMFYSRPSALAYVDEVRRLHELSRRMLHAPADSGREVAKGPRDQAPASPQPFLTDEERAAVRSFTLYPPHIPPTVSVRMWNTELVRELAAKSDIADVLPTLRPEAGTPARVLLKLTSPDGRHGEGLGGLTADELWLTLRDDGRERSAPWVLANLSEGIMPVKPRFGSKPDKITVRAEPVPVPLEPAVGDDGDEDGALQGEHGGGSGPVVGSRPPAPRGGASVDRNERFRRFVLTFTQPAIARRFVRCWHKRVVYDALLDRSVVVDAVAIM